MNQLSRLLVVLGLLVSGSPALSTTHILTVTGKVSDIFARQDGEVASVPNGQIAVGDTYELKAVMDFSTAELGDLFDADPTVNVYSLSNTRVFASIGGYTTEFTPRFNFNSSVQFWNDRVVVGTTDAQSFRFFNFDFVPIDTNSFEVGTGQISESLGFSAFDFTAMARDNDLISQLAPLSAFGAQTLSYGLLNADTELFVGLNATVESSVLTAVPEPASWLMLILGFGIMGVFLRRTRVCIDKRAIKAHLPS